MATILQKLMIRSLDHVHMLTRHAHAASSFPGFEVMRSMKADINPVRAKVEIYVNTVNDMQPWLSKCLTAEQALCHDLEIIWAQCCMDAITL